MSFMIGQRWLSHSEPQLGLGRVVTVEIRRITLEFPAADELRTYSLDNAPLNRVTYDKGESIQTEDEQCLTISAVNELNGILFYTGIDASGKELTIAEQQLNAHAQLSAPLQRLSSGSIDRNTAFNLRLETLQHLQALQQAPAAGLLGARTNLLPHQIYIAHQVAKRYAPRVLLADEVGLGKTIEAGLIVHQQLHTGRAQRVLILLPPALQHQWLVEMLRRFNLRFSLFDAERYAALVESNQGLTEEEDNGENEFLDDGFGDDDPDIENPFETEQLILCSIDWLVNSEIAFQDALSAPWDLLVVDEAHHLHWSEQNGSDRNRAEEKQIDGKKYAHYQCVEQLAQRSSGLILLTATPEQAGIESHFSRLRLLDPARFHNLKRFKEEAAEYSTINHLVQSLQQEERLDTAQSKFLGNAFGDDHLETITDKNELIQYLLDRHGTGRALFRNTRAAIGGFPQRHLHPAPLPKPALYNVVPETIEDALYPELAFNQSRALEEQWLKEDPRVQWLEQLLKKLSPEKVLVICAHAETALALEEHCHLRAGIRSAAFHEGLTLLERDRAAAWFAETESGAQALVCSEMGSEGRNFQFAQHLVLFDLPLNPDLLEQRIGRLDRIGQGPRIDIHVPYLLGTAQETLFRWYHEGLDLFQQTFAAGYSLYEQFAERLHQQLIQSGEKLPGHTESFDELLTNTITQVASTRTALLEGRDALLELNSCNIEQAEDLIESISSSEQSDALQLFMQGMWDQFGIDHETHSENALVLRPSGQMLVSHFPELTEEGCTVTFNRQQALQRDDMVFLTWEHPMVHGAIEMLLNAEYGNAALASIGLKALPPGTLLLEAVYQVQCLAPKSLQVERFLPCTPLRFVVNMDGKNLSTALPHDKLNQLCKDIPRAKAPAIIAQVREAIPALHAHTEKLAQHTLPDLIETARKKIHQSLGLEIDRLLALQKVNPAIRDEEIRFFQDQLRQGEMAIAKANVQLQGVRLLINIE